MAFLNIPQPLKPTSRLQPLKYLSIFIKTSTEQCLVEKEGNTTQSVVNTITKKQLQVSFFGVQYKTINFDLGPILNFGCSTDLQYKI